MASTWSTREEKVGVKVSFISREIKRVCRKRRSKLSWRATFCEILWAVREV